MLFENNVTEFFRKIGSLLTTCLMYAKELFLQSSSYLQELMNSGSEMMVS